MIAFFVKLPINLITIASNLSKIRKSEKIIIHFGSGYGNHFTHHDLCRLFYKKKNFTYIHFFETARHNQLLTKIFNTKSFYFVNNFILSFFGKKIKFGEFEKSYFKPQYRLILFIVNVLKKKHCKILFFPFLYEKTRQTFTRLNIKPNDSMREPWMDFYFHLIKKNKDNKDFNLNKVKNIQFQNSENFKKCCFYLRYREMYLDKFEQKKNFSALRSGTANFDVYLPMIEYIISKGYYVFLVGDYESSKKIEFKHDRFKNFIELTGKKKQSFELFAMTNCDLFVGEHGGPSWFSVHAKKKLFINNFPIQFSCKTLYPDTDILNKDLFKEKEKIIIGKNLFYKDQMKIIQKDDLDLINNNSEQLLNFAKENII